MQKLEEEELLRRFAYQSWLERGRPLGSPEIDWQHAQRMLQTHRASSIQVLDAALGDSKSEQTSSRHPYSGEVG
jgi:hypothetical protein